MENAHQNKEQPATCFDLLAALEPFSEILDGVAEFAERSINDLFNYFNLSADEGNDPRDGNVAFESSPCSELLDGGANVAKFDERAINDLLNVLNLTADDEKDTRDVKAAFESSPWLKSFEELRAQMFCVNENIYKKIITPGWAKYGSVVKNMRTCIRYSGYWEFQSTPFDSTPQHGSIFEFRTAHEEVVEGLEAAVYTMKRGEKAQFVVSHKLLFGEENCPPGVEPRSDALLVVELISFSAIVDNDPEKTVRNSESRTYSAMAAKIDEMNMEGFDFYQRNMYKQAICAFEKAAIMLKECQPQSDKEYREQKDNLLKLYSNLIVCYNDIDAPTKTINTCREIRHLSNNRPPFDALYQEGRALRCLGEYERAHEVLTQAQHMEPENEKVNNELITVEGSYSGYKKDESLLPKRKPKRDKEKVPSDFEATMVTFLTNFKQNPLLESLKLPAGLTKKEIKKVDYMVYKMGLRLTLCTRDLKTFTVWKN